VQCINAALSTYSLPRPRLELPLRVGPIVLGK
jgi:hypothetical protein